MILRHSQENSRKTQRMCHGGSQEKSFQQGDYEGNQGVGRGKVWPRVRTVFQKGWERGRMGQVREEVAGE